MYSIKLVFDGKTLLGETHGMNTAVVLKVAAIDLTPCKNISFVYNGSVIDKTKMLKDILCISSINTIHIILHAEVEQCWQCVTNIESASSFRSDNQFQDIVLNYNVATLPNIAHYVQTGSPFDQLRVHALLDDE